MPKKPFFRAFDGWWYVKLRIGGKRVNKKLVKGKENEREAYRLFCELQAQDFSAVTEPSQVTVADICREFLAFSLRHHEPPTYNQYRYFLVSFDATCGTLKASAVIPLHVTKWMDRNVWNPTSRNRAASSVKRAFNHALDQGLLKDNPFQRLRKDQPLRRERIVEPGEREKIFGAIRDRAFREFLFAITETGARPGEVRKLTREFINLECGLWVFPPRKSKTGKRTGKPRVIYLTPPMVELTKQLLARVPEGPLFRNTRGKPWTRNAVRIRFRNLRSKFPELKGIVAYCYRHTYTTEGLVKGVPIATMAELLGHESTRMIDEAYGHLAEKREHLRDAARKVRDVPAGGETPRQEPAA
jgi:integrase